MTEFRYHQVASAENTYRVYHERVTPIGRVTKRLYRAPRAAVAGWRWYAVGGDGRDVADQDDHGYMRRDAAAAVLLAAYRARVDA